MTELSKFKLDFDVIVDQIKRSLEEKNVLEGAFVNVLNALHNKNYDEIKFTFDRFKELYEAYTTPFTKFTDIENNYKRYVYKHNLKLLEEYSKKISENKDFFKESK